MIIDGVEVLYTMRNGKIVDPNIPTDGLVCYLDTRGKNNTDVYRNTLLDLSGNGNHRTLQNFNFTEESGYVVGGLKFDGVDDRITPIPFDTTATDEYTVYIDFTVADTLTGIDVVPIFWAHPRSFILAMYYPSLTLIYNANNLDGDGRYIRTSEKLQSGNRYKIIVVREGLILKIYLDGAKIVENTFTAKINQVVGRLNIFRDYSETGRLSSSKLHKVALYNRALTDEEATKLMEV